VRASGSDRSRVLFGRVEVDQRTFILDGNIDDARTVSAKHGFRAERRVGRAKLVEHAAREEHGMSVPVAEGRTDNWSIRSPPLANNRTYGRCPDERHIDKRDKDRVYPGGRRKVEARLERGELSAIGIGISRESNDGRSRRVQRDGGNNHIVQRTRDDREIRHASSTHSVKNASDKGGSVAIREESFGLSHPYGLSRRENDGPEHRGPC
jgi:hypothetical protein